jgi:predicted transcriptional regulator
MPNTIIKSYAEQSGKSIAKVEELWDEIKEYVDKKYPKLAKARKYAYVNSVLAKKLGLKKNKKSKKIKESYSILKLGTLLNEAKTT